MIFKSSTHYYNGYNKIFHPKCPQGDVCCIIALQYNCQSLFKINWLDNWCHMAGLYFPHSDQLWNWHHWNVNFYDLEKYWPPAHINISSERPAFRLIIHNYLPGFHHYLYRFIDFLQEMILMKLCNAVLRVIVMQTWYNN